LCQDVGQFDVEVFILPAACQETEKTGRRKERCGCMTGLYQGLMTVDFKQRSWNCIKTP
jgi:hypothetical protein